MSRTQNFQWEKLSLGTCYYPEHWDKCLWQEDLRRMKKAGIQTVRIAEFAWSIFEPREGVFSFSFFDEFLDLAEQEGMKVIMGTPTSIPPVWLTEKYPETLNCRKDGVLFRHGMRRHYNYNSLKLQELASRIVHKVAEHYAKRSCIVGWQIDNELNCEISEYYSESDHQAFRQFLQEKYGTLEELNRAWGTVFWNQTYTEWEQVYAPRPTINDMVNPHQNLDYIRFISDSTIRFCRMQSEILRNYVKPGDFITTNGMFGNVDNHQMTEEGLDVFTYDSYPNFALCVGQNPKESTDLSDRRWSMHLMEVRSICPHFGIMEQQSGANGWSSATIAPAPKPGQLTLWAMQSIAHGADYISFFRWRTATIGTEIYWHGILDYDNRDNRKLAEVTALANRILALEPVTGADYVAKVALIKDYDNNYDAQYDTWHGHLAYESELEIFVAGQISHTPMDIRYLRESTTVEEISKYRVLIYPHPVILSEKHVALLTEYVQQGGCLILGARTGQKDLNGHCVMAPMPGLFSELTNTTVSEYTMVGPGDDEVPMDWNGISVETGKFHDILAMREDGKSKILASYQGDFYDGAPALIETTAGKGRVLHYGGTFTRKNVQEMLRYTGVSTPYQDRFVIPESCELAVRRKGEKTYFFLLNYSRMSQEIVLKQPVTELDTGVVYEGNIILKAYETKVVF